MGNDKVPRLAVLARPVLVTLLAVLTLASSASAECAWVLWRYGLTVLANGAPLPMTIAIDDIADNQERCKSLMSASVARSAAEPDVVMTGPHAVAYKHKNGEEEVRNYGCAPDTTDLRVLLKDLQPGHVGPNAEP